MSHYRTKIQYESEGTYGSTETHTLYVHHNLSCDYVTVYDERGEVVFSYGEWSNKDMWTQLKKAIDCNLPLKDEDKQDGVDYWTPEDIKFIETAWERNRNKGNQLKYSTPEQLNPNGK